MFLYVVRHGQPIYGPVEQLTEIGHKQARALVPRMVQSRIDRIYSSPMRRARETAEPTARALGLPINIEPWTSEDLAWSRFAHKCEDGHTRWIWNQDDVRPFVHGENHDMGDRWTELDIVQDMFNGVEGYEQLIRDSDDFMARLGYVREGNEYRIERPNHERVALFCHQGFSVTWFSHLLRIPPNVFWLSFDVTHTGVTVIEIPNKKCGYTVPRVLCLSDMSHLFADDNTEYTYHNAFPV